MPALFKWVLDSVTSTAIDLVEAAYDLRASELDWLEQLLEVGAPVLDHGCGVAALDFVRDEAVVFNRLITRGLPSDYEERFLRAVSKVSHQTMVAMTPAGWAGTWTELSAEYPEESRAFLEVIGYRDALGILATDPNGCGIHIAAPLGDSLRLTPRRRERWKMLGAHIATAHRLRRALAARLGDSSASPKTELPLDAEAVIDASSFRMVDSAGAEARSSVEVLRDAARGVDCARGGLRSRDPEHAFETWTALVSGRWSLVDWFDTDERRYVLAIPNAPEAPDPRGLTEQEAQVVAYVLVGDTSKLIAYRLGLSKGRISGLLSSAMRKLGVKTKTALVEKLRPLGRPVPGG